AVQDCRAGRNRLAGARHLSRWTQQHDQKRGNARYPSHSALLLSSWRLSSTSRRVMQPWCPRRLRATMETRHARPHLRAMPNHPAPAIPYSLLDLAPVTEGSTPAEAFANSLDLARHAERLGYTRFWLAEHHNLPGIASAATAVLIGHIAGGTSAIRVGAGGVMLPNHA